MTDIPLLCTASVVRNITNGRQTQDRRPAWRPNGKPSPWQKVKVGDRLWVREAFALASISPIVETIANPMPVYMTADNRTDYGGPWRPSIHCPRWASRLTLVVTEVHRQRVQDISCADAIAEGIKPAVNSLSIDCDTPDPRQEFAVLWDSLYGHIPGQSWAANPEVVAITFQTHRCNIDQMPAAKGEAA